jgi:5'-nucleotidase/UDP-sugar diphosphatase
VRHPWPLVGRLVLLLSLCLAVAACDMDLLQPEAPTASPTPTIASIPTPTLDATPREIVILHTSDEHGHLEPATNGGFLEGGASLASALWADGGHNPLAANGNVLLLSGGDNWTGPAASTWFQGESTVEVMNAMGYRASVPGNHEFDFGQEALDARLAQAQFPYLAANVFDAATGELSERFQPYTIVTVNGIRVGIIGLALRSTPSSTAAKGLTGLRFGDYEPALRQWAPVVRSEGAQVLVVETHACTEELLWLAQAVEDLDIAVLLGGHCHSAMLSRQGDTLIGTSAGEWRDYVLTRLTVDPTSGEIVAREQDLVDVLWPANRPTPAAPAAVQQAVDKWQARVELALGEVIGYTASGLSQRAPAMHNLLVDAWLWAYPNAQLAISNTGGFRAGLDRGEITLQEVVGVLPFENELLEIELTGAQIVEALTAAPEALVVGGGRLQNGRLVLADGTPARADEVYRVLVIDYLYDNAKYPFARYDPEPYETSIHWRQPAIDWIRAQRTTASRPLETLLDPMQRLP